MKQSTETSNQNPFSAPPTGEAQGSSQPMVVHELPDLDATSMQLSSASVDVSTVPGITTPQLSIVADAKAGIEHDYDPETGTLRVFQDTVGINHTTREDGRGAEGSIINSPGSMVINFGRVSGDARVTVNGRRIDPAVLDRAEARARQLVKLSLPEGHDMGSGQKVTTKSGDIEVRGLTGSIVEAASLSGKVALGSVIATDKVLGSSKSGDVSIEEALAPHIEARSVSGDATVRAAVGYSLPPTYAEDIKGLDQAGLMGYGNSLPKDSRGVHARSSVGDARVSDSVALGADVVASTTTGNAELDDVASLFGDEIAETVTGNTTKKVLSREGFKQKLQELNNNPNEN